LWENIGCTTFPLFESQMLGFLIALGLSGGKIKADQPPTRTSFITEKPTDPPDGYSSGYDGAVFVGFLIGLAGLGAALAGTILYVRPLVLAREDKETAIALDDDEFGV
jgi:hypothetical protein